MTQHPPSAIWVFDSQCVLCDGGVQYTLRHEKAPSIQFVAIQSPEGRALARQHGVDPDDPTTLLFIENGIVREKSDAVIALSRHLNGPARLFALSKIVPAPIRDVVYGLIAKHRYRLFGKKGACIVPTVENKHRFTL